MAIREIMVETAVEHLGSDATDADLSRYQDHLENALLNEFPGATIELRPGTNPVRVEADTNDERESVEAFIEEHFNRGEWTRS